jgi:hypothetical protein
MRTSKIAFVTLSLLTIFQTALPSLASMDSDVPDMNYVNLGNVKNGSSVSYKENEKGELLSVNDSASKYHILQWVSFGNNRGIFRLSGSDVVITPGNSTLGLSLYQPNKGQVFKMIPTPRMGGMYNVVTESNKMICTNDSQPNTVLQLRPYVAGQTINECEFGVGKHTNPGSVIPPVVTIPVVVKPIQVMKQKVHNHKKSNFNKKQGMYNCDM